MTGDVLVPVLVTFLVVNVILLIRAGAKGRFGRRDAEAAAQSPELQLADGPAVTNPTSEDVAVESAEPDPPEIDSASDETGRDLLTGLDDAATWDRRVADENARVKRYPRPVTVVRLELDGLERLTQLLGDEAGDRLLRAMADTLRRLARDTDHVARLGFGGFGVLMPETSEDAAIGYVDRVSRACELWLDSGAIAVRLVIGWAAMTGDIGPDEVQRIALERMRRGQWLEPRPVSTVAGQGPAARDPGRPPVTNVSFAADPRLDWERCRDPDCDHKRDHRRDRSR